tara:strand:+ start:945 stop:1163 length:219 start_codon:yes stop_codon:yes gene_type:complete
MEAVWTYQQKKTQYYSDLKKMNYKPNFEPAASAFNRVSFFTRIEELYHENNILKSVRFKGDDCPTSVYKKTD